MRVGPRRVRAALVSVSFYGCTTAIYGCITLFMDAVPLFIGAALTLLMGGNGVHGCARVGTILDSYVLHIWHQPLFAAAASVSR